MASLTKRSLFSVGDGGFAVTIPKSWASFYELKAKDRLIVVSNGFLVFVPEKMAADREVLMRILKKLRVK